MLAIQRLSRVRGGCRHFATASNNGVLKLAEPLKEYELFEDTIVKSISNERQLRKERHLEFDVEALAKVAVDAAGASHCTSFTKMAEGSSNRVFLLKLDNDKELIARLPFRTAGAPYLTTASEVATLSFLRKKLKLPVPDVRAWSSRSSKTKNDVGAEYMIYEMVPGVELQSRLDDFYERPDRVVDEIVRIGTLFAQTPFAQIGSLYFKEDVDDSLKGKKLYADGVPDDEFSNKFRVGPSLHRSFWAGQRASMKLDRGPWPDLVSYARAIAESEKAWLKQYAKPLSPDDRQWRSGDQNDPAAHVEAIERYLKLVPHITPPAEEASAACLWHPDLHASNIFVPESGEFEVKGIIDWQGACVGPLYQQMKMPDFLEYQPSGETSSPKPADAYQNRIQAAPAPLSTAAQYNASTWTGAPLLRLLLHACDNWASLSPSPDSDCPIGFTAEERRTQEEQWEERAEAETVEDGAVRALGVMADGWVLPEKYGEAKRRNGEVLDEQLALAGDEEMKAKLRRLWPFPVDSGS